MPRKKTNKDNLTPTQKNCKKPRPVFYEGEHKNMEPEMGRDIIVMYVGMGLGHSAIRHIIGASSDKPIEDVIRQHMFGRKNIDADHGELRCPGNYVLDEKYKSLVQEYVKKYGTSNDPYIFEMLNNGKCGDDPAYGKKIRECPRCEAPWGEGWIRCPYCEYRPAGESQKRLF